MRTFIFIPPVSKPTGGVAVLVQMVTHLRRAGFEAFAVPREGGLGYYDGADVPVRPWNALDLTPDDIWVAPEGWPNALAPGLSARARCVVYCQNWSYLFSSLPENVHWTQLPVHFLAVSQPVAWFIKETTGRDAPILRPGIDLGHFVPPPAKPDGPIRIAFMPRKNKALVERIRETLLARLVMAGQADAVRFVPISGQTGDGVTRLLADAHIFLASGFPEGCPLPPLEAMACGCLPVGFGGFGGWDYMRQAPQDNPAGCFAPWWPLRDVPWDGNGLWAADADVPAAALALEEAVRWLRTGDPRATDALAACRATAQAYAEAAQAERLAALWTRAASGELFPPSPQRQA
ncbi:MAG: glycosyltransferase family 1 protein [Desulfovibrionaceae bacterium]